jgi:hypothetical protein
MDREPAHNVLSVSTFTSLPIPSLDRIWLQQRLEEIGRGEARRE